MDRTNYFFSSGIHESTPPASRVATHDADAEDARGSWDVDVDIRRNNEEISASLVTFAAAVSQKSSSDATMALIPHHETELSLHCNPTGMAIKSVEHSFDGHNATYLLIWIQNGSKRCVAIHQASLIVLACSMHWHSSAKAHNARMGSVQSS